MSNVLTEFLVKLTGVTDEKSFDKMGAAVDGVGEKINSLVSLAVTALTTGAFAIAIRNTAQKFDELGDTVSRMSGITAHELSQIAYAASLAGTDAQTATRSIETLSNTLGQAINGVGRGAKAFENFGLSVRNADGTAKTVPQVLDDIRLKLAQMGSTAEKTAFLQRLGMDSSMLEFLSLEQDRLAELNAEYEARIKLLNYKGLNPEDGNIEQALADQAGDFNDNLQRMSQSLNDVVTALAVRLIPKLSSAFSLIDKWFLRNTDAIVAFIDPIADGLGHIIGLVARAVTTFLDFNTALDGIPLYIGGIAAAWKVLNTLFLASPLGRIVGLITALGLAITALWDDFKTFKEGGESFFDWSGVINTVNSVINSFKKLYSYLDNLGFIDNAKNAILGLLDLVSGAIGTVLSVVKGFIGGITGILTGNWALWNSACSSLVQNLTQLWNGFKQFFISNISNIWLTITEILPTVLSNIGKFLDSLFSNIADFASNLLASLLNVFSNAFEEVSSFVSNLYNKVTEGFTNAFTVARNAISSWFSELLADVTNFGGQVFDALIGIFSNIGSKIMGALGSVWDVISGLFSGDEKTVNINTNLEQPSYAAIPSSTVNNSTTTSSVDNRTYTDNVTFNVSSPQEANAIDRNRKPHYMRRQPGGAA